MVRTLSFREKRVSESRGNTSGWMDTVPKSLATVLEKRLLLNFTGNKVQKDKSDELRPFKNKK